jgi:PIN domain nuclease of toxin-antitoxin system
MDGRIEDGQPVSVAVRETLSAAGERLVSAVTAYEIGVKATIGKLATPDDLDERLEDFGIGRLAITWAHTRAASQLPLRHRDSGHAADPDCALRFADAAAAMRTLLTDDPAAVDEAIEAETLRIDGSALVAGWFAGMIKRLMMIGRWRVERRPLPHPYVHHDPSSRAARFITVEPSEHELDPSWDAARRQRAKLAVVRVPAGEPPKAF